MKAVVFERYGPPEVLELKEVEKPVPKDKDILVKVHATTVNFGDISTRNFKHIPYREFHMPAPLMFFAKLTFGLSKPRVKILGSEFGGEVEEIGKNVTRFKVGDKVFGYLSMNMGAYAQYLCMPEKGRVEMKPTNMSYDEAAAIPYGAIMAVSLLRKENVQPGQKVLINGASGGIGSAAVQLAKYHGADVTGVCGTPRVAFVKSLGADHVIDYTKEDFTRNGETYDLIFDIFGLGSFSKFKGSLKENGHYLLASFKMKKLFQMLWTKIKGGKRVICRLAFDKTEDLDFIKELAEKGKFKAVIDKRFPMEEAADAHRYIEEGHKRGHVIIMVDHGGTAGG